MPSVNLYVKPNGKTFKLIEPPDEDIQLLLPKKLSYLHQKRNKWDDLFKRKEKKTEYGRCNSVNFKSFQHSLDC